MYLKDLPSKILKKPFLLGCIVIFLNLFLSVTPVLILHQKHIATHNESFIALQTEDTKFLLEQQQVSILYAILISIFISCVIILLSHFLRKSYQKIEKLSHFDGLTGLYNRLMFLSVIKKEILKIHRTQHHLFLVILDIDDFKPINDNYGHLVGDEAIKITASTLTKLLRASDTIARFGGDEFVICIVDEDKNAATTIINRILDEFNHKMIPITMSPTEQELQINLSIGYTAYKNEDDFKTMLHRADQALYISKEAGKNTATFIS